MFPLGNGCPASLQLAMSDPLLHPAACCAVQEGGDASSEELLQRLRDAMEQTSGPSELMGPSGVGLLVVWRQVLQLLQRLRNATEQTSGPSVSFGGGVPGFCICPHAPGS